MKTMKTVGSHLSAALLGENDDPVKWFILYRCIMNLNLIVGKNK